jgi:hypothetical protein
MERYVAKALHRAAHRDRKRTPRMKVSGKNVLVLQRVLRKSAPAKTQKK